MMSKLQLAKLLSTTKKVGILIILFLLYLLLRPAPSFKSNNQNQEQTIRGVWMTNVGASVFHHTFTLDNVFHHLAKSGYNQIYISTYGLTGTIYPSTTVTSHPLFLPPFTDVLKAVEFEGRRQNLKIYAWLEYGLMLNPSNQIAVDNPEWLLKTNDGETIINNFVWLNPEHPQVQEYILNIITEVAQYKNLAGIQLDDHWAVPIQFGNKTQAMTDLTGKVSQRIKQINPEMELSLSPNPYGFSLKKYNQDWLGWAKKGYLDEVVIQIYRPTTAQLTDSINSSRLESLPSNIPVAIGIYTGNWAGFFPVEEVEKQIKTVENLGYGYSIFCWEYRIVASILDRQ